MSSFLRWRDINISNSLLCPWFIKKNDFPGNQSKLEISNPNKTTERRFHLESLMFFHQMFTTQRKPQGSCNPEDAIMQSTQSWTYYYTNSKPWSNVNKNANTNTFWIYAIMQSAQSWISQCFLLQVQVHSSHCRIKQEKSYRISMQGYGNLTKAVRIPCKKCMEIRPSAWNSNR